MGGADDAWLSLLACSKQNHPADFNQAMRRCAFFGLDFDPLMESTGPAPLSHTLAWGYKAPAA
jgi:hypothetical protein